MRVAVSTLGHPSAPAITTPLLDLLCIGGLSILAITPFLFLSPDEASFILLPQLLLAATLLNGAHFIASYRLLYSSRTHVARYRAASIYVPAALVLYCSWAALTAGKDPNQSLYVKGFLIFTAFYLALHYTGQTWGMMASFSHLEGVRIADRERRLFRACLYVLVGWQVVWSLNLISEPPRWLATHLGTLNGVSHAAAVATIPVAFFTFVSLARRTARPPPPRVWIPLAALYFWYALIWKFPGALMGVQIAHALQYIIFPLRVEANRHVRKSASGPGRHMLFYLCTLSVLAWLVFVSLPGWAGQASSGLGMYVALLITAINVHHFYIDGCVWKLRNPIVRDDIFAHLPR